MGARNLLFAKSSTAMRELLCSFVQKEFVNHTDYVLYIICVRMYMYVWWKIIERFADRIFARLRCTFGVIGCLVRPFSLFRCQVDVLTQAWEGSSWRIYLFVCLERSILKKDAYAEFFDTICMGISQQRVYESNSLRAKQYVVVSLASLTFKSHFFYGTLLIESLGMCMYTDRFIFEKINIISYKVQLLQLFSMILYFYI